MLFRRFVKILDRYRSKRGVIPIAPNGAWQTRYTPFHSLRMAATLFNEMGGRVIVEIGSGIQGEMSGNSVLVWARQTRASEILAFDLSQRQVDLVKEHTKRFPQVKCYLQDGIEYLKTYSGTVDLLYLDFWTDDPPGELPGEGRAQSYLLAYQAAKEKLAKSAMILIDDTDHIHPWKHTYIIPEARRDGFVVRYIGRQTLLVREINGSGE